MRTTFIITLTLFVLLTQAQKQASLSEHYHNEYKTFKEFIKYSESIQGDTNIDVKFYHLDLEIGVYSPWIEGLAICRFDPVVSNLNEVRLSLNSALDVISVGGAALSFYQDNDVIVMALDGNYNPGETVEIEINYEGVPVMAGGYKGLRYETHGNNEPIIASLSTPYIAHYWYPCKDGPEDKPDSVFVDITLPDESINGVQLMGVSNGVLENVVDNGDTRTFQWRHRYPIVTYYVMVAISNYVTFSEQFSGSNGDSFPLEYFSFQEDLTANQAGVATLPEVMDYFSEVFGPYPFKEEKYGMTQLGFYGAIENQTNTIQNKFYSSWFYTTIHELGHMWFGDMITLANWHHSWLNEGFATWSEAVWDEHAYGFEGYKDNMENNEFWGGGTLYLENAADTFNTFQSIFYSKGAYAVHMLRGVLGDDLFFEALLDYTQDPDYMYQNASTEDLQFSFENSSGLDLEFFFEQWVYDEYWPFYHYNYGQTSNNELYLLIHQAQEELYGYRPVFEMPVRIWVEFTDASDTVLTVWNDEQTQTFYFALDKPIALLQVDPDKWILRKTLWKPELPVGMKEFFVPEDVFLYPNPFNQQISIKLPDWTVEDLTISVFNLKGQKIRMLFDGSCTDEQEIYWDGKTETGKEIIPGVYIVSFTTNGHTFSKRVVYKGK